jgi:hypothetical protein
MQGQADNRHTATTSQHCSKQSWSTLLWGGTACYRSTPLNCWCDMTMQQTCRLSRPTNHCYVVLPPSEPWMPHSAGIVQTQHLCNQIHDTAVKCHHGTGCAQLQLLQSCHGTVKQDCCSRYTGAAMMDHLPQQTTARTPTALHLHATSCAKNVQNAMISTSKDCDMHPFQSSNSDDVPWPVQ